MAEWNEHKALGQYAVYSHQAIHGGNNYNNNHLLLREIEGNSEFTQSKYVTI